MLRHKLRTLKFTAKETLRGFWMAVTGFFHYGTHFKRQEELKRKRDIHYHFREKTKKKLYKWTIQERAKIKKMGKFIPQKDRDNMCI